nr:glycosyltransferase [Actinopolymorpha cephalotaxi]
MFHTSTEVDAADVARYHPSSRILISPDTVRIPGGPNLAVPQRPVKLVHISRISPIKNLHRVIQALAHVETRVQLDVWGPIEDPAYWKLCNQATAELPVTAEVRYRGQIHSSEVHDMLGRYHALVCCSLSENFGQNVAEALAAGCPVIVSNTLHWATVVDGTAGWTVDPVNLQDLAAVLKMVTMAPDDEWRRLRIGCSTALGLSQEIGARMSGRQLIEAALSS